MSNVTQFVSGTLYRGLGISLKGLHDLYEQTKKVE